MPPHLPFRSVVVVITSWGRGRESRLAYCFINGFYEDAPLPPWIRLGGEGDEDNSSSITFPFPCPFSKRRAFSISKNIKNQFEICDSLRCESNGLCGMRAHCFPLRGRVRALTKGAFKTTSTKNRASGTTKRQATNILRVFREEG